MDGRAQTGVVGCVHIDDYERDLIRKHEKTRQDKEDDRTRHVLTLNANAEPVFLTYRGRREIDAAVDRIATSTAPLYDFTAPDGVRHTVWRVPELGPARAAPSPRCRMPTWPTDTTARPAPGGRGRSCGPRIRGTGATRSTTGSSRCCSRPTQLRILPYNRVVRDLNGQAPAEVLDRAARTGAADRRRTTPARAARRLLRLSRRRAGTGWSWTPRAIDRTRSDRLARRVAAPGPGARRRSSASAIRGPTSGSTSSAASAARRSWSGG